MKDRPASYFLLYILGGAVLFITDGVIVRLNFATHTHTHTTAHCQPTNSCLFNPGFLHRIHLHIRSVSSPLSASHLVWQSDQCVLGICHRGQTGIYISVIQIHTTTTNQCQPVGMIVVQCLLLILYSSHVFIFMGTCVLGLFISSVFPCMVALTEDMVNYKGCVTTVLVTSAGTGEMVLQLLTGQLIHSKGSYSFLLVSMISSCIGFTVFLNLLYIQQLHRSSQAGTHIQFMRKLFS
ncbi:major facilitator superfamily domain-containing protein 4A isoform X3 [Oncorhynchus kisutch]|uniref:major facilitator superfamily domain-containing protein 4A isoform X3 n=1 Tax=Oncorhynchus kisutch TaxID=8019 RepID=UPI0012DBCCFB|nr:major facilitator superfamily domain-containing protein 4A isoform X3 [Oncorhynchus kisutch]